MSSIRFVELPPDGRRSGAFARRDKYATEREACRANPGRWLLLTEAGWASQVDALRRTGRWDGFEFAVRRSAHATPSTGSTPRHDVYVRFVGDES